MADETVPPVAAEGAASPPGAVPAAAGTATRAAAVWHRIRSGEDPLAFGAVVAVLALAAGLFWFWAGARHGAAAASPGHPGVPAPAEASRAGAGGAGRGAAGPVPAGNHGDGRGPAGAGPDREASDGPGPGPAGAMLAVHVAGAVLRPGLYHLAGGADADAVTAAGGQRSGADPDRLNLAARVVDGQRIFVPRRGEPVPADVNGAGSGEAAGGAAGAGSGEPVDLNTADLAALDALPGVGPATARAIIDERTRRGGFRSTRDLLRIAGIGESRFARLKDRIRV